MSYQSFEELRVWKKASRLAVDVYGVFKTSRDRGLKDQITRSAVSIASNIAEGAERESEKDFARFLRIAKGSAAELRTQLYIAAEIGELGKDDKTRLVGDVKKIAAMLHGLTKSVGNPR